MSEYIKTTSFLPHESALAANTAIYPPNKTGFGTIVGGTAPAVLTEVTAFAKLHKSPLAATLDSPFPIPRKHSFPLVPFAYLGYDQPRTPEGVPLTQADMIAAYRDDSRWMRQHIRNRGYHPNIIFAHHTAGMVLEPFIQEAAHNSRDGVLIVARPHSPLLARDRHFNPDFYKLAYSGSYGDRLWKFQEEALKAAHAVLFPTNTELEQSIEAVVGAGILTQDTADRKFLQVPIPIDLIAFSPDTDGTKRVQAIDRVNQLLGQTPKTTLNHIPDVALTPSDKIIGYVGRFDFEKGVWGLIEEYIQFLQENRTQNNLPYLLLIGGLTNKPGVLQKHQETLDKIRMLPPQLQRQILMPGVACPHQEVVHAYDMEIFNSLVETFNIGDKQARAASIPVALTQIPAHIDTNCPDTAVFYQTPSQLRQIFFDVMRGATYSEVARTGMQHARSSFQAEAVCANLFQMLEEKFPDFFKTAHAPRLFASVSI